MKKFNQILNIIMGSFFGVFIGSTISNYREYMQMPDIYEMQPEQWYCHVALS